MKHRRTNSTLLTPPPHLLLQHRWRRRAEPVVDEVANKQRIQATGMQGRKQEGIGLSVSLSVLPRRGLPRRATITLLLYARPTCWGESRRRRLLRRRAAGRPGLRWQQRHQSTSAVRGDVGISRGSCPRVSCSRVSLPLPPPPTQTSAGSMPAYRLTTSFRWFHGIM